MSIVSGPMPGVAKTRAGTNAAPAKSVAWPIIETARGALLNQPMRMTLEERIRASQPVKG